MIRKLLCFILGHEWGDWYFFDNYGFSATWYNGRSVSVMIDVDRRECRRCALIEEKERKSGDQNDE